MARLINQLTQIKGSRPENQVIPYPADNSSWMHLADDYPIIGDVLNNQSSNIILREDIFSTQDNIERIIKTLMWGFLVDNRFRHIERTMPHIEAIANILNDIKNGNLSWKDYVSHYNRIINFNGVGRSKVNLLFYYFNVKCDNMKPLAITGKVTSRYVDFEDFIEIRSYTTYPKQIRVFNDFAQQNGVTVDQIEYYLYRVTNGEATINQ